MKGILKLEYINLRIISGQKCYCLKNIFQILRALGTMYFHYVEFSDFYVNQSLAGQTKYITIIFL
jgi:hypothetical protein